MIKDAKVEKMKTEELIKNVQNAVVKTKLYHKL